MKIFLWIFGSFFFILSLLSLFLGWRASITAKDNLANAEQATATLIEWVPDPNYGTSGFCPVYEFTAKSGDVVDDTEVNSCKSEPDPSMDGSTIQVYFDPDNPQVMYSGPDSTNEGLIFGIIGFGFFSLFWIIPLLVGAFMVFMKRVAPAKASQANTAISNTPYDPAVAQLRQLEEQEKKLRAKIEERRSQQK